MDEDTSTKYSPSRLEAYKNCPRQYKYRYIDKIPRAAQSVEAYLGTCVHEALEKLYEGIKHGKIMTLEEVSAVYDRAWQHGLAEPLVIRKKEFTLDNWRTIGQDCIKTYYGQYAPFDQDKTVAIEGRIGFPLIVENSEGGNPITVRLEGFMDRLSIAADGAFEIHDYKTGGSLPTQADQDEDWQLAIYNIGVLQSWPDALKKSPVRLKWHFVRHGKTITSTRTQEQLKSLSEDIARLIAGIKQDHAFEPRKSALCDWCDYREMCPLWKHVEAYQLLPEADRKRESGVRLADQFSELENKKKKLRGQLKAIESEQEDLEPRILRYADEHELLTIQGTDCRLDIQSKEEFKFPSRVQALEKLQYIEAELKKNTVWSEVSRLDQRMLMEGFKARKWPQAVLQMIEGWIDKIIRHEITRTVRARKNKESEDD